MEKNIRLTLLYDQYSELLSEKKQRVFELYYHEDLSLAEISEPTKTTRQGVRDLLARTADELLRYEEALGLLEKSCIRQDSAAKIKEILQDNPSMLKKIEPLLNELI
jgi:hypothetical protein